MGNNKDSIKNLLENIATEKQIKTIKFIENMCDVKFEVTENTTKKDVFMFINKWLERANLMKQLEDEAAKCGVKMAEANFLGDTPLSDEGYSHFGSIADEKFKGDILRGRNTLDALSELQKRTAMYEMLADTNCIYDYNDDRYEPEEIF